MLFQKLGKKNLYRRQKFSWPHHIKKCKIYYLSKCNSEELNSPQVSLNDSKTMSQIYFEKLFKNKEI